MISKTISSALLETSGRKMTLQMWPSLSKNVKREISTIIRWFTWGVWSQKISLPSWTSSIVERSVFIRRIWIIFSQLLKSSNWRDLLGKLSTRRLSIEIQREQGAIFFWINKKDQHVSKSVVIPKTSDLLPGNFANDTYVQGCICCGILVSGIRACGVSSEHMENMEMFSCSPT